MPLRREVVLGGHPPVHAAAQAPHETLRVSPTARYHTLNRLETEVAAALGRDAAARAEPVVNAWRTSPPRGCSGYHLQGLADHHGAAPEPCLQEGHAWGGHAPQRLVMTEV